MELRSVKAYTYVGLDKNGRINEQGMQRAQHCVEELEHTLLSLGCLCVFLVGPQCMDDIRADPLDKVRYQLVNTCVTTQTRQRCITNQIAARKRSVL